MHEILFISTFFWLAASLNKAMSTLHVLLVY